MRLLTSPRLRTVLLALVACALQMPAALSTATAWLDACSPPAARAPAAPASASTAGPASTATPDTPPAQASAPQAVSLDHHATGATAWTYQYDLDGRVAARADVLGAAATEDGAIVYVRFAVEEAEAAVQLRLDHARLDHARLEVDGGEPLGVAAPAASPVTLAAGQAYVGAFHVAGLEAGHRATYVLRLGTPSLADYLQPDDLGALVEVGPFRLQAAPSLTEVTPGPQHDASGAHEG
jgi:YD repeat-containing protein